MKTSFKLAKLVVLAIGMFLESHQVPFVADVRRQVQVNIGMASLYALLYSYDNLVQWANALLGLFALLLIDRVLEQPVYRPAITDQTTTTTKTTVSWISLSPVLMWLVLYTVWNVVFASYLSGWTVALAHNGLPLLLVFATGYSHMRTSKETAFYYWAFFRAVCISMVELQYLGSHLVT
jgi:hypothetical protein